VRLSSQRSITAFDEEQNPLPLFVRPPESTHVEMVEEGYTRLRDAYPEAQLHWYRMEPIDEADVYVE
jgi:hypothetical protein